MINKRSQQNTTELGTTRCTKNQDKVALYFNDKYIRLNDSFFVIDRNALYSDHDRSVLVPAQERVLSVPRLCVFNISPSLEEVLVLHDASELSSDGAVDCFVHGKVCREENVEETLMDLGNAMLVNLTSDQ